MSPSAGRAGTGCAHIAALVLALVVAGVVAPAARAQDLPAWIVLVLRVESDSSMVPTTGVVVQEPNRVVVPADFVAAPGEFVVLDGGTDIVRFGRPGKVRSVSAGVGLALLEVENLKRPSARLESVAPSDPATVRLLAYPPAELLSQGARPLQVGALAQLDTVSGERTLAPQVRLPNVTGALINVCGDLVAISVARGPPSMAPVPGTMYAWHDGLQRRLRALGASARTVRCDAARAAAAAPAGNPSLPVTTAAAPLPPPVPQPPQAAVAPAAAVTPGPAVARPAPAPAPAPASTPTIQSRTGMDPTLVREVQAALRGAGFYAGELTGTVDVATRKSIEAYQADRKMPVDGKVSSLLRDVLLRPQAPSAPPAPVPAEATQIAPPSPASTPATAARAVLPDWWPIAVAALAVVVLLGWWLLRRRAAAVEGDESPADLGLLFLDGFLETGRPVSLPVPVRAGHVNAVVGRSRADVELASDAVSRQHLRISGSRGELRVQDLGSRNGTAVNGVPVLPGESARLAVGDKLTVGEVTLLLRSTAAEAPRH